MLAKKNSTKQYMSAPHTMGRNEERHTDEGIDNGRYGLLGTR